MGVACDAPVFTADAALSRYTSSEWAEREFCGTCGSSLFWTARDGSYRVVSAQSLDDATGVTFETQIFVDEKPSYYAFADSTTMMTGAEVFAAFTSNAGAEKRD
ncbi:glutathione-dependent formaldehyde-activating enzyme [Rhizobium sp. PP-F2F-G48]|nr:glutathione-dependent formaldehyde-activating enzyme [Rhizobium sp. PP-F2F-G48]